jgi:LemA protein
MGYYIFLGIVLVLGIWGVALYNRFVSLVNRAKEALSDIDVQMKRRFDLIPNLIETVKGYAAHERGTLDAVTEARAKAAETKIDASNISAEQLQAFSQAEAGLESALGKLFAVAENYPDLKANQNFLELQRELVDTENKVQASRRFYNGNVRDLNTALEQFPGNIVGSAFSFTPMAFFELAENEQEARQPVKVSF